MERVKERVLEIHPVDVIYLLGISINWKRTECLFSAHGPTESHVDHCYLLVLHEKIADASNNVIQEKIENGLKHSYPSTAIVMDREEFSEWIMKGHPFAATIKEKAFLVYQKPGCDLPLHSSINKEAVQKDHENFYTGSRARVEGFLAAAELHKIRKEYKLSAFMLHQAAEQALLTMIMVNMGLRVNSHSIEKLVRYCSMFCYKMELVFPRNTEKEKRLLTLLNKAYIESRYGNDYSIGYEELSCLFEKVVKLNELMKEWIR
jgi:HEPN domain-containing protein